MGFLNDIHEKIFTESEALASRLDELRSQKKIVFTNGCFDLLHRGHVSYLCRARDAGDLLVVALNSDESVRRLKGEERPLNRFEDRAFVLAALECVDFVTVFEEDTPLRILELLKPHFHTKGGDYTLDTLPEREVVERNGGEILLLPFEEGFSTTGMIRKIFENNV